MLKKYKYLLFIWCAFVSTAMGILVTKFIIAYPELKYQAGVVVFLIYNVILIIGVKLIVKQSKKNLS